MKMIPAVFGHSREPATSSYNRAMTQSKNDVSADVGDRFADLVALVARLRGPEGCPWDREQSHESIKGLVVEEAYEVVEAIDEGDDKELAAELGDLLLQVVFHSDIAQADARFSVKDVIGSLSDKLVRRHPHVFGG